jgi:hypothetical protein
MDPRHRLVQAVAILGRQALKERPVGADSLEELGRCAYAFNQCGIDFGFH